LPLDFFYQNGLLLAIVAPPMPPRAGEVRIANAYFDNINNDTGEALLPTKDANCNDITYKEFDVNNKAEGQGRDSERFVRGSDGSTYYTDDHYHTFSKIV
jgi:hypothetical protein